MELENPGKMQGYQTGFRGVGKNRTKVVPLPAGTTIGTIDVLLQKERGLKCGQDRAKRRTDDVKIWRE
jgi:hypothetical protein